MVINTEQQNQEPKRVTQQDPPQQNDDQCVEDDTATQKSINIEKVKYCDQLYLSLGEVRKWEVSYAEYQGLFNTKKCLFNDMEENYRILRNFNIKIGTEFMQTNESIKENFAEYVNKNKELSDKLKSIGAEVKILKEKMHILRDQACNLEACKDDSCNKIPWEVLTGGQPDNGEQGQSSSTYNENCSHTKEYFNQLICRPKKLIKDADSIFVAAADVKGIHVFSNLSPLEPLRLKLSELAQSLNKHMLDSTKIREGELKAVQEALTKIIQESAGANVSRYDARSNFEGNSDTLRAICCSKKYCTCVLEEVTCESADDEHRLKKCGNDICLICGEIKDIACSGNQGQSETVSDKKNN